MSAHRHAGEGGAIAFAERVLNLLDQGSFSATYKYAVLLGLLDLCMERVSASGATPEVLTTRQLAEKVVGLYWPHTVPYPGGHRPEILRQNSGGQAEIVSAIRRFRESVGDDPLAPLPRARAAAPKAFEHLVRHVEWKLVEMPLPKLQRMGRSEAPFIYEIAWEDDGVRLSDVRRYQRDGSGGFDNAIRLLPDVGDYLVQLNGVLRPLVHRHWADLVARFNRLEESRLERFLFGTERTDLGAVRRALLDLQSGHCFYCGRAARGTAEVDHFIPWSRYPDDGLDNLVLADRKCNGAKRDFLASAAHVERWRRRMAQPPLEEIVSTAGWHRNSATTLGVARAVYTRLPEGFQLWQLAQEFVPADATELAGALG